MVYRKHLTLGKSGEVTVDGAPFTDQRFNSGVLIQLTIYQNADPSEVDPQPGGGSSGFRN
jgi:hypothetical protein